MAAQKGGESQISFSNNNFLSLLGQKMTRRRKMNYLQMMEERIGSGGEKKNVAF
jgi:hypothetical protein